jgi:hypothetical protein
MPAREQMKGSEAMNRANKTLLGILAASTLASLSPALADGDGSIVSDNFVIRSIAGPQGPASQAVTTQALGFAPPVANPLAAFAAPAANASVCWYASDPDRPFGYWGRC